MRLPFISAAVTLIVGSFFAPPAAQATEDEFGVTNGLYAGTVREPRGPRQGVSLELSGESIVMVDVDRVTVGRANFVRFGPGGKDGRTTFKGTWTLAGGMTRGGRPLRVHRGEAPLALTVWPDGHAIFCHPIGKYDAKAGEVRVPPGASMPDTQVRCLDVARALSSAAPTEDDAPPVPTRDWEGAASECFVTCRKAQQIRSVPLSQIEADCRAECTPNAPVRRIEPPRHAP